MVPDIGHDMEGGKGSGGFCAFLLFRNGVGLGQGDGVGCLLLGASAYRAHPHTCTHFADRGSQDNHADRQTDRQIQVVTVVVVVADSSSTSEKVLKC